MKLEDELLQNAETMLVRALGYLTTLEERFLDTDLSYVQEERAHRLKNKLSELHGDVVRLRKEVA